MLVCAGYLYLAAGRVYPGRRDVRALQVLVLALVVGAVVLGYRFAISCITLYTT